eukprot:CAMPEP_0202339648 /NCGR_PEP_ID=MMETSP1126-20121109/1420_1 /ASSEMBLY_ACC=CAM_ASM_000457 /TAXON_ID=3047 /ORGANISM="Dunaliella tertiolecta, Strain CCMP1320" /LENGTH=75 /DNA_ID=CAMNT_0048930229 /DNA_START=814 /DNA_END=1042 /DNA_ORIENTATION=+
MAARMIAQTTSTYSTLWRLSASSKSSPCVSAGSPVLLPDLIEYPATTAYSEQHLTCRPLLAEKTAHRPQQPRRTI